MANTSSSLPRAALLAGVLMLLGPLAACEGSDGAATPPTRTTAGSGTASPPGGGTPAAPPSDGHTTPPASPSPSRSGAGPGAGTGGGRCHTAELRASVGRVDPGAGQRNHPVVLTNTSSRTCTVHGYPGAAFVDAGGRQVGPDPRRAPGFTPTTVTRAPGATAWAGLSYSDPGTSGARTAAPAALLVTPPDERTSLEVPWRGGRVPVSGNASTVFLTVFQPGDGT
ncbi:MAG TPA: DUF4232 domain-containing protein [Streptomyces sp.]|nr:DUF4232 domain-containing protein [Streptomyces sp.]